MTIPNAYALASIKIGATALQCLDGSASENNREIARSLSGGYQVAFRGVLSSEPRISCKTSNIAGFLSAAGVAPSVAAVVLGFVAYKADGTREALSGYTATAASALVVPRSLNVAQDGDAQLAFDVFPVSSDGATAPLAYAAALPDMPTEAGVYTLGSGGTLSGAMSIDLDFGWREKIFKSDGAIYPTRIHIEENAPVLRQRVCDLAALAAPVAVTGFTAKLFQVANKGLRGAGVITITIPEGLKTVNQLSGAHPGEANAELVVGAVKGTGAMLTVAAA